MGDKKPGYHWKNIPKGTVGQFSKITEEFHEALDAWNQGSKIMIALELSDLYGAMESYVETELNLTMRDLETMSEITRRAFENGER